jgi:hypothetical protein
MAAAIAREQACLRGELPLTGRPLSSLSATSRAHRAVTVGASVCDVAFVTIRMIRRAIWTKRGRVKIAFTSMLATLGSDLQAVRNEGFTADVL